MLDENNLVVKRNSGEKKIMKKKDLNFRLKSNSGGEKIQVGKNHEDKRFQVEKKDLVEMTLSLMTDCTSPQSHQGAK